MQTRWQTWSHPVQAIVDALRGNVLLQILQFRGVGRPRLGSHVAHELTCTIIFYDALHIMKIILVALGTSNGG